MNINYYLVLATDNKFGIGYKNNLPWCNDVDMSFFKYITTRPFQKILNVILMGNNTFKLFNNKPLTDRLTCVLSRTYKNSNDEKLRYYTNIDEFVYDMNNNLKRDFDNIDGANIYICGGSQIYTEFVVRYKNLINCVYHTYLDKEFVCDVFLDNCVKELFIEHYKTWKKKFTYADQYEMVFKQYTYKQTLFDNFTDNYKQQNYVINKEEKKYLDLIETLINKPTRQTRNGLVHSSFGTTLTFDCRNNYPLLTTKKVNFKAVAEELFMFLRGDTNTKVLENQGINIWKGNTNAEFLKKVNLNYEDGDMGSMYGFNLIHYGEDYKGYNYKYGGINQVKKLVQDILTDPTSRRLLLTTYNPSNAHQGVLYPCHGLTIQFYVEDNIISCSMYQRSADMFLGVPFNIASYALLLYILCAHLNTLQNKVNYKPGNLFMIFGDYHVYKEHDNAVQKLLLRHPYFEFPKLKIVGEIKDLSKVKFEDFELTDYLHYPIISAPMVA